MRAKVERFAKMEALYTVKADDIGWVLPIHHYLRIGGVGVNIA